MQVLINCLGIQESIQLIAKDRGGWNLLKVILVIQDGLCGDPGTPPLDHIGLVLFIYYPWHGTDC